MEKPLSNMTVEEIQNLPIDEFEKVCHDIYIQMGSNRALSEYFYKEKIMHFREWAWKLPYLQFPPDWKVRAVPPFGNLMVRYHIWGPKLKENDCISVYLDCYNQAGSMPWPYWEFYGGFVEDCCRCKWDNIDGPDGFMDILRKRLGESNSNEGVTESDEN